MGKDCALCGKSIGLFSSEYTCTECHTVVCGHCCVKQKGDDKKGKSVRLCKKCLPPPSDAPKNTQGAVAEEKTEKKSKSKEQDSKKDPTPSLPDPNSPEERQKRLAALEARVQANKEKQAPARDPRKKRPVPPPTVNQNNTNNSAVAQEPREEPPREAPAVVEENNHNTNANVESATDAPLPEENTNNNNTNNNNRGTNPSYEAAMRRRQLEQEKQPKRYVPVMSPEKKQLLAEIEEILKKRGEDEPFGIRSADEAKLRTYLNFLKEKYKLK